MFAEDKEKKRGKKIDLQQIRRKLSEKFDGTLKKLNVPCKVLFTLRKFKTYLPSLKPR